MAKKDERVSVGVWLTPKLLAKLDAYVEAQREHNNWNRNYAINLAIKTFVGEPVDMGNLKNNDND